MSYTDIIFRKAQRTAWCRGCGIELTKGTDIIYTYSPINRGQNILFCIPCAKKIGKLADTQMELFDEALKEQK